MVQWQSTPAWPGFQVAADASVVGLISVDALDVYGFHLDNALTLAGKRLLNRVSISTWVFRLYGIFSVTRVV